MRRYPLHNSTDVTLQPSRPSVEETYNTIIADLEKAKGLVGNGNGTGGLSAATNNALLSRVYLYTGQFEQAATAATAAINDGGTVTSRANFADL